MSLALVAFARVARFSGCSALPLCRSLASLKPTSTCRFETAPTSSLLEHVRSLASCPGPNVAHNHERDCEHHEHDPAHAQALKDIDNTCWSCHHTLNKGGLVCKACDKIQPADLVLNYFELFGLSNLTFDVDLGMLDRQFKLLQWQLHPDKAVGKSEEEKHFANQAATLVNMGYTVLKRPLSRANYILAQKGVVPSEGFEGTIQDPELLMEVMEAREQVEESNDPATLQQLLYSNKERQQRLVKALSKAFKEDDIKEASSLTHQLTYLVRLEKEILKKL